ncbi:simple sugar transport system permease protein [Kineococcus xinjiangensis]|uniref:Simple sugar transport system permease protein n=1 Tax=Kineococcus xinjiangensis TaxID=512762 RepID=A0A2S6ITU4_9ACTN|nr:ABC transporter permease [Kineococcus xinjiangensis]PPK97677.1 simple sugar transport system permease protein [Kineococcus xinjiangensis]
MSARPAGAATEPVGPADGPVVPEMVPSHQHVDAPPPPGRRLAGAGVLAVAGLACILGWGLGAGERAEAGFRVAGDTGAFTLPVPGTPIALGVAVLLVAAWQAVRGFPRRWAPFVVAFAAVCFVVSFLCWAQSGAAGAGVDITRILRASVFLATPLILGALAGVLCERSGVVNVAIEGQMLLGAFAGAVGASLAASLGVGVVAAVVAGALMGVLLALFALKYRVDQVILGVVLNALALGLTGWAYEALLQRDPQRYNSPNGFLQPIAIPLLSDIPVLGPLLFNQNIIVYLMFALIVVVDVVLFRTRWGLRTRAVGEHPKAAATVGIRVLRVRWVNVIAGGALAGLAGAFLSIGTIGTFTDNMSAGKGFIALAAVIFGRWSPRGATAAALLFGFATALQQLVGTLQTPVPVPSSLLAMLPYLVTVFAVAGLVGRVRPPAASNQPYPAR